MVANIINSVSDAPRRWSVSWVLVCSILVLALFLCTQILIVVAALAIQSGTDSDFNAAAWGESAGSNGLLLSLVTFGTTVVCVPFIRFLVGRREQAPWYFLALRPVGAGSIATWILAMAALLITSDTLTLAIGRPLVPDFMVEAYESSGHPALLLAALLIAAPLFEEVFFRGFLLSALRSARISVIASAILSAVAWSAIHLQYDLYGLAAIFAMGLLLATARFRARSIVPCIVMHSLANAVAFTEVAFLVDSAAA